MKKVEPSRPTKQILELYETRIKAKVETIKSQQ